MYLKQILIIQYLGVRVIYTWWMKFKWPKTFHFHQTFSSTVCVMSVTCLCYCIIFYSYFRHTSSIENFNNLILKYASKRVSHENLYYGARMSLAALDHNIHAFRENARHSKTELLHRKYSKRSKTFTAITVKENKLYPHIPLLLAKIMRAQKLDTKSINRPFTRPANDPKAISRNIGMVVPSDTADILANKISRFGKWWLFWC